MKIQSLSSVNFGSHKPISHQIQKNDAQDQNQKVATNPQTSSKIASAIKAAAMVGSIVIIPAGTATGLQSCSKDDAVTDTIPVASQARDEFQKGFLEMCPQLGVTVVSKSGHPTYVQSFSYTEPSIDMLHEFTYNEEQSKKMGGDVYDEEQTTKKGHFYSRHQFVKQADGKFLEKMYYKEDGDDQTPIGNKPVYEETDCQETYEFKNGKLYQALLHPEVDYGIQGGYYEKGSGLNKLSATGTQVTDEGTNVQSEKDDIVNILVKAD